MLWGKKENKDTTSEERHEKVVKEIESNDADVLNLLASGKYFEQYERDILFTFNIDIEKAESLMIKRCNKEKAGAIKGKKTSWKFLGISIWKSESFTRNTIIKTSKSRRMAKYGQEIPNKN